MTVNQKNFIELNRTFYQLSAEFTQSADTDDLDVREALGLRIGDTLEWDKLLAEYRVILLSEAGSGKTEEIRQTTLKLLSEGKPAFFIRLEHISNGLEGSFEEGSFKEFKAWLNSNDEGWLLLDSVDEARLKDPKDFERAIKKLANQISPAMQRVHIVITGRITAWRPKTDLALCEKQLPFTPPNEKEKSKTENEEEPFPDDERLDSENIRTDKEAKKESAGIKVYSISDLSSDQIKVFVYEKGISDTAKFLDDIERHDAWSYTTRPQDLEEIVEFWNENKKVGTRLELMQHSIKRRLNERDQDRADSEPITVEKAREGVKLIAAAATLMHESTIGVPDGSKNTQGINAKSILTDWNDKECLTLLGRPIFDAAIYGSVRFHHRSAREFLTAEWLSEILKKEGSRRNIENLFFREQYGIQVLTPSMKPILSWLVLFDDKIRQKVFELEPEIFFEGGDPSRLPLETRTKILKSVCSKIALNTSSRSVTDYAAVQRFAKPDMADEIKTLIKEYKENSEITSFLLRMVWQGRIKGVLPEAKSFALNDQTEKYSRIAAIRAVKEVGSRQDYNKILQYFLSKEGQLDRILLSELIDGLEPSEFSVSWILEALEKVEDKKEYSADGLSHALEKFVERLDPNIAAVFLNGAVKLLNKEPVIERRFCEISARFGWLMNCSAKAIEKLILSRHSAAMDSDCLSILTKIPAFQHYHDFDRISQSSEISDLVREWNELNHCLFWKDVEETRKALHQKKGDRLTNFWHISVLGRYWSFGKSDFELVKADISERKLLDDRLVALSLAFQIYSENKRPRNWREQLKILVEDEEELKKRLDELLHPPAQSEKEKSRKREEARWKRQEKSRKRKRQKYHADWKSWLNDNFAKLRDINLAKQGKISGPQHYLHERMRKLKDDSGHWTSGNWGDLIKEYGENIATAFRDGLLNFWKNYKLKLRSEYDKSDKTTFGVIFGLSGLEVDSAETPNWPDGLGEQDAELACRYAFSELNGFPNWFPKLHASFPNTVNSLLLREIDWELKTEDPEREKNYILDKLSWNGQVFWNDIAAELLKRLQKEPINLKNLSHTLKIVQGSTIISNNEITKLSSKKCKTLKSLDHMAYWFATWVGVDPESAINALLGYLSKIKDRDEAIKLAMNVIVKLVGERRIGSSARETFRAPEHLKKLYLLMHQYIKVDDDINRTSGKAYSPGLRDNAQEARNGLFSILKDIPGKESFLALVELAKAHPVESSRSWMLYSAKERAEMDADISPLSADKFCEFSKSLEFSPTNHRELFDLAVQRLLDLKYDLEEGDNSIAPILIKEKEETKIRNYIGGWCRDKAVGRYSISQEEELADAKKPDCRFLSSVFDAPVPIELKLVDNNWGAPKLFERLENQLCGDYLRDNHSNRGIFLLVYRGEQTYWKIPNGNQKANFSELVEALRNHWDKISENYPNIEQIVVISIDLTKRSMSSAQKSK